MSRSRCWPEQATSFSGLVCCGSVMAVGTVRRPAAHERVGLGGRPGHRCRWQRRWEQPGMSPRIGATESVTLPSSQNRLMASGEAEVLRRRFGFERGARPRHTARATTVHRACAMARVAPPIRLEAGELASAGLQGSVQARDLRRSLPERNDAIRHGLAVAGGRGGHTVHQKLHLRSEVPRPRVHHVDGQVGEDAQQQDKQQHAWFRPPSAVIPRLIGRAYGGSRRPGVRTGPLR